MSEQPTSEESAIDNSSPTDPTTPLIGVRRLTEIIIQADPESSRASIRVYPAGGVLHCPRTAPGLLALGPEGCWCDRPPLWETSERGWSALQTLLQDPFEGLAAMGACCLPPCLQHDLTQLLALGPVRLVVRGLTPEHPSEWLALVALRALSRQEGFELRVED